MNFSVFYLTIKRQIALFAQIIMTAARLFCRTTTSDDDECESKKKYINYRMDGN
jgi:hypothetical protein